MQLKSLSLFGRWICAWLKLRIAALMLQVFHPVSAPQKDFESKLVASFFSPEKYLARLLQSL
ncbi:hypothetical protein M758_9G013300 [Ceratodon purpureus]|uniref:Uncharacterized protein n=1 Tax=Ceratodon purpureus TaxID=3225 RepID=A0A8T0GV41_CERPU|nr:hypothetical protein KC19_9G013700 [Ceratodon purpureus]KAG0604851.1 hypothetical protein M758_9G013300 [Ceratodon purpureus]